MLEASAYGRICNTLAPEDFYRDANRHIYACIQTMWPGQAIDILTVTKKVRSDGLLDAVGGPYYITWLTNRVASAANIEFHAAIMVQERLRWRFIDMLHSFNPDEGAPVQAAITQACEELQWNDCDPMELLIDYAPEYFEKLGLTAPNLERLNDLRTYAMARLQPQNRVTDRALYHISQLGQNYQTKTAIATLTDSIALLLVKQKVSTEALTEISKLSTFLQTSYTRA